LAITSSFFCASPWKLSSPIESPIPASGPLLTAWLIILHARAMTSISSRNSGDTVPYCLCCSIRYWVSVTLRMRASGWR
jgi:hypothetical protein